MRITYSKSAVKHIKSMDGRTKERIRSAIQKLPFGDIKKLAGYTNLYRLRIGDYRVLFSNYHEEIYIEDVLPRGEAYKRLS